MRNLTIPSRRTRTSCSVLALATVLVVGATPAAAQSFLGSGSFTHNGGGSAGITTAPNLTTITVNAGQTVIDWTPTDNAIGGGAINFQSSGTTANFLGSGNYAVLNRINPADSTRSISMNGTIQTLALGAAAAANGSLYFYTPGGFVIGSNAVINVGSLVLSASPITVDGSGIFINGAANTVTFGQAGQVGAQIATNSGSQINATGTDAYVAMIAPRVQHNGTINVSGSAALVSAEAATISFSPDGLFDIHVTTGTTDNEGIEVNGTIAGPAGDPGDHHRAYLVAVPKNSLLTMAIGSGANLGFAVADSADVVGNTVVLSAGHDISNGSIAGVSAGSTGAAAIANLDVRDSIFTSAMIGEATGYAYLSGYSALKFFSNVSVHADGEIWLSTQLPTGSVDIDGTLTLSTQQFGGSGENVTASRVEIFNLNGGDINVDGLTSIDTDAFGAFSGTAGINGGSATGGNVNINSNPGGSIALLGGLNVSANGYAGGAFGAGVDGGAGTGGQVLVRTAGAGSALTVANGISIEANGYGGSGAGGECFSCDGEGGIGQGGDIRIIGQSGTGSTLAITGNVSGIADGFGGSASAVTAVAGQGRGGGAQFYVGTGNTMSLTGNLLLQAEGNGGNHNSADAADGIGGRADVTDEAGSTSGAMTITGNVELSTDGQGGFTSGIGSTGGDGIGGTESGAYLYTSAPTISINGSILIHSDGTGGNAANGVGGMGTGGTTYIYSGESIQITGTAGLSADGTGGNGLSGGDGLGGTARVNATVGGTLDIDGATSLSADAQGGSGSTGAGGDAEGGLSRIYTFNTGSRVTIDGNVALTTDATGGNGQTGGIATGGDLLVFAELGTVQLFGGSNSLSNGATGGNGSSGNGGDAFGAFDTNIYAAGSGAVVTISGATTVSSNAVGGNSDGAVGGEAYGGDIDALAFNGGSLTFGNNLTMAGNARGGAGTTGGGYAQGGTPSVGSFATVLIGGNLTASADATGGQLYGTDFNGFSAGDAQGGSARVVAEGGLLTLTGAVTLSSDATGGSVGNFADFAGDGTGGLAGLVANAAGTIDALSTLSVTAIGTGGSSAFFGSGIGGNGQGGDVRVQATAANAAVTIGGVATLDASGEGSTDIGGNGSGGTAWADSFGASTASLDFLSNVSVLAQGTGGNHNFANGGNGEGGEALLQASAGSTLTVGGDATVNADAFGGYTYDFDDGVGGDALGGTARIQAFNGTGTGGTIDIEGSATVSANGNGGDSYSYVDGAAGNGTGGTAQLYATNGTVTIGNVQTNGGASVTADGVGGYSENGLGGDGTGGTLAEIAAVNGDITIAGFAFVSASGLGGDGLFGGDGLGSGDTSNANPDLWTGGAHIYAQNGDIVINGGAGVSATGTGGDGGLDNNGYNGDFGGDGGSGTGGWASIHAANSNSGASSISIDSGNLEGSGFAQVNVFGIGGDGGAGNSGNFGGDGGNGGDALGGAAIVTAAAGNGTVNIGIASIDATARGGAGGNGGNGDGLPGGNGGDGGSAIGGFINVGTESGLAQSTGVNAGQGNYGSILADASATGGDGGNGNFGSTSGAGGNGGNAAGGTSVLLVRGSRVDVDDATLTANATGGDGGLGDGETSADGNGGNATVGGNGGIAVLVTERFQIAAQRGTLNGGDIRGTAIATGGGSGGFGATAGTSQTLGGNLVVFRNSDGDIGSLDFLVQADTIGAGAVEDAIAVVNGDLLVDGAFNFVTDGTLSLLADLGDVSADSFMLHAADFVPDTVTLIPSAVGTFFGTSFDIQTGNNFLTLSNIDSVEALSIIAPGAIQIGNVTGDADIILEAQSGEIDIGNILGGAGIDLDADDFVATGNVVGAGLIDVDAGSTIGMGTITNSGNTSLFAGTSINVGAINSGNGAVSLITGTSSIFGDVVSAGSIFADSGDDIFLGNLTAPGDIELLASGNILIGDATAGESIDLDAGGYIDGGNMTAGDSVYAGAGEYIDLLDISAGIVNQSTGYEADYNVGLLAGTTIDTGNITAFNSIGLGAQGNITTGIIDAGNIFLALSGGNMSFGTIVADGTTYLADDSMIALGGDLTEEGGFDPAPILAATPTVSGGSITLRSTVDTGRFVAAASGAISGSTINSDSSIYTVSGGNTTLTNLDAGSFIFQRSQGLLDEGNLDAGGYIDARSGGAMTLGNLVAGDYVDLRSNGAILLGNATSGETIYVISAVSITGDDMTAGDSVLAETNGALQLGDVTAGTINPSSNEGAQYAARFSSGAAITIGNVTALGRIGFGAVTNLTTGDLVSGEGMMALVGGNMSTGSINDDSYVYIGNYSMSALGGTFLEFDRAPILALPPVATGGSIAINGAVVTGNFQAAAGTTLTGTTINSGNQIIASSGGNMTLGELFANNDIRLTSGGNILTGNIDSGDDIALVASGSISTLDIFAYDDVSADAGTTITTDDITGNSIDLFADGNIDTGNLLTQLFFVGEAQLFPGASITVQSGGNVDVGTIDALDGVYVSADSNILAGTIEAEDFVQLFAGGNIGTGSIVAGGDLLADAGGTISLGVLDIGQNIALEAVGNIAFVSAEAGNEFDFSTDGSVTGGNVVAGNEIGGEAGGNVTLGNLTAGLPQDNDFSVGIAAAGNIIVGNVSGADRVGFATLGNLTTGNVAAGSLAIALVGGDITTGSITTAGNGRVYIADDAMYFTGGGTLDGEGDFDLAPVLALAPVATGGSITINGPVVTGRFQAAAGDNLSTRAITANQIEASAGDNATIDDAWRAGSVALRSGDINITANGSIDAGTEGSILLNAVSTDGPALIGDGLTGSGYALSNAEFGRISGGDITIAVGGFGGDADTLIGDLTITGPLAGSNVESSTGGVEIATLQEDGAALDGTLRIVGDVVATGFGPENYLGFYTQNFELDAATGSISITSSGSALAGILELYASRIHVAEGTLLDQLAANPQFAGYREALNQPAAVSRPEGVINAASFEIEFGGSDITGPYTLFVQNLGTTAVPAGFLLNAANISDDSDADLPPGSLDMVINGQIIGEGGTLTGIAVRDLLVTEFGTGIFAAGSTINGCPLVGACITNTPPPPRIDTIVRTDVQINDPTGLGDGVDGSLTNPPNPLLDTDFLAQSGDVDDPVSGAGNPSLMGTSEEEIETCDSSNDSKNSKCKPANKGDGK